MSLLSQVAGRFNTTMTGVEVTPIEPRRLVTANPKRFALGFSIGVSDVCTLSLSAESNDLGILLNADTDILWFDAPTYGTLPMLEWWGRNSTGVYQLTVWQVIDTRG